MSIEPGIDLSHRVVLITGAGSGLGAATAIAAAVAGAQVILLGRTVRKLEATDDAIRAQTDTDATIVPLDLEGAGPDDYADIGARIEAEFGRLDALVHCAAMLGPQTPLEHYPLLEWARVMQVNLTGPLLLTQACLPLLRHSREATVVFIDDPRRSAYWGGYGISKTAAAALADMLDDELEAEGRVQVRRLQPGPMRTPLRASAFPGALPEEAPPPDRIVPQVLALLAPDQTAR